MKKTTKNKEQWLVVKNISKKYDKILALDNVSLNVDKGEIIALLGPNGAGKSTLMNIISGYLAPSLGNVFIKKINIAEKTLDTQKNIGFLSEGAPLYSDMKVKTYLKYMIELKMFLEDNNAKQIINDEFERIVKIANIENVLEQKIETLSKGYVRRVGFAQSIIGDPSILLLDEPTDGLDPNQKDYMKKLIKDMGKGKSIIVSTHLLDEAESIASRIVLINKGKIVVDGTLDEILSKTNCQTLGEAFKLMTQEEKK